MAFTRGYWHQTSTTRSGRRYSMEPSTKALKEKNTSVTTPRSLSSGKISRSMGLNPPRQLNTTERAKSVGPSRTFIPSNKKARSNPTRSTTSLTHRPAKAHEHSQLNMLDFVLFQANQVASDAMTIKRFVTAALDPTALRLKESLGDHSAIASTIEEYLSEVNRNVSNMADKIIRDAHCKALEILSEDANRPLPFFNVDSVQHADFKQFRPGSTFDATTDMGEWCFGASRESMVQYSSADYNIKGNSGICKKLRAAKPFTRLPDSIQPLLRGRVIPQLSPRKQKSSTAPTQGLLSPSEIAGNATENASSKSGAPVVASLVVPLDEHCTAQFRGMEKLLDYHNELLSKAERRSSPPYSFATEDPEATLDTMTIIARAVTNGKLRPPSQVVQRQMDNYMFRGRVVVQNAATSSVAEVDEEVQEDQPVDGVNEKALEEALLAAIYSGEETLRKDNADREAVIIEEVGRRRKRKRTRTYRQNLAKKHKLADGSVNRRGYLASPDKKATQSDAPISETTRQEVSGDARSKKNLHEVATLITRSLEPGQQLPELAYRESQGDEEQFAWRCGIKHAMGYYYHAGDRKHCPGCGTHFSVMRSITIMDFYLPTMTWTFQDAPQHVIWSPSPPTKEPRKGPPASHNAIAKDAYWAAVKEGATKQAARCIGVQAVLDHFEAKRKAKLPPTPEPEPAPEPVILPPHPSGSLTMEHGQNIPECYRWRREHGDEDFAWRCDGNHALGRYYIAGDKKSCPGCGGHRESAVKSQTMDFYIPLGTVVRQDAVGLVDWKPRKPKKMKVPKQDNTGKQILSHNQRAAKYYWELRNRDIEHEDALARAIDMTNEFLDGGEEALAARRATRTKREGKPNGRSIAKIVDSDTEIEDANEAETTEESEEIASKAGKDLTVDKQTPVTGDRSERNEDGGVIISLVRKRRGYEQGHSDTEGYGYSTEAELILATPPVGSSSDEDVSDSDSE